MLSSYRQEEGVCIFPQTIYIGIHHLYVSFGQVEKTKKDELLAVGGGKDVVGYGGKRGFCGVAGTETMLGRGETVIASHAGIKLLLGNFFN